MSEADRSILAELATCPSGKGLLVVGAAQRKAARRLASKGWVDILEAAGLFVVIINDKGRADLAAH